jgi:hypothetical protein
LPTNIVKIFKDVTGLRVFKRFPGLENEIWRGVLWSPSYYVGTAGHVSAERYIREQQTEWNRWSQSVTRGWVGCSMGVNIFCTIVNRSLSLTHSVELFKKNYCKCNKLFEIA